MITEKDSVWGSNLLERLSADLKREFPGINGFSVTNLKYCRLFFKYISISPQSGDEIKSVHKIKFFESIRRMPWGHIKLVIGKLKNQKEALFYIQKTLENSWSRDVLALQIQSKQNSHSEP